MRHTSLPADVPPIPAYHISPFVRHGDLIWLTGLSGSGKTNLVSELALAVGWHDLTDGQAIAGLMQVDAPGRVAIIDGENDPAEWARYMLRAAAHRDLQWPLPDLAERLLYVSAEDTGLHQLVYWRERAEELGAWLGEQNVKFAVIDPAASVFAPASTMDMGWVNEAVRPLRRACQRVGCTLLIIVHTARPNPLAGTEGAPHGTSAQDWAGDVMLYARKAQNGIDLVLKKRRRAFWIPEGSLARLTFTPHGGGYVCAEPPAWPAWPPGMDDPLLDDLREWTSAASLSGPRSTLYRQLSRLTAMGLVETRKDGRTMMYRQARHD